MALKRVDLWQRVNANAFTKVTAFGKDVAFWFEAFDGEEYFSSQGRVSYYGTNTVVLHCKLQG